jgi:hypothetical protein
MTAIQFVCLFEVDRRLWNHTFLLQVTNFKAHTHTTVQQGGGAQILSAVVLAVLCGGRPGDHQDVRIKVRLITICFSHAHVVVLAHLLTS